ncbi:uncharacterized protein TNIN_284051 [Trichonephila inaurata madagascariensis]|uniref:Uncharacterized protein n=1 Tax=Trichonephila inaurata madagascariensis TaxID=2747483 RepID=A0A8X7C970_9ARAC|nr:uncharacterized protein TNIN_284051 [Trichonephila inaurata madagascariensis]
MNYQSSVKNFQHWMQDTMTWFSSSTSAMDIQTAVICGGVFVFSALVVYLISVFGMRERTYEEAMEEQRRRNQETVSHTKSDKTKKEKKFKKWGKRTKEKVDEDKNHSCDGENKGIAEDVDSKGDADVNSSSSQTVESKASSVKKRVRQRKTIVLEKEEDCSQPISSSDDTDDLPSLSSSPITKQPIEEHQKCATSDKSTGVKEDFKNETLEMPMELPSSFRDKIEISENAKASRKSPTKKSKKVKSDHPEFSSEFREGNDNRILNMIKTTSLSEDEIQSIVDTLGAKQKFLDKRKGEISSLKKIIQEKEDSLRTEQKMLQSANERISELLQELSEEKAQATATEKSLRDALNQEQQEIKALHGMMQRKREQYGSEISSLQSKMQQLKNKMKEENALALQRLQDENNQLQSLNRIESEKQQRSTMEISRLQHEVDQLRSSRDKFESHQAAMQEDLHRQIQQLEKHIEQLINSHQEEEYSYKQRINEMSNKIQQTENARSSLVQELQNAQSVCSSLEADNSSVRQRYEEAKHQLKSSEQELLQLQSRLEESNRQQRDLGNCLEKLRGEVMDLSDFKREQLQVIQKLKQENEALITKINRLPENSDQKQQNGSYFDKSKVIEIEEHEAIIQEKENILHRLLQELEHCKCEIVSLSNELESQKKLNKEFADKNDELSELLLSSENKLKDVIKTAEIKVQEAQIKIDNSSKDMQNLLNEQIKEVELALRESFTKELVIAQQDAENVKKEADEKILKSQSEANVRLEEFQESLYERLKQMNTEADRKINDAVKEKEQVQLNLENLSESIKDFLQRIFPELNVPENMDNKTSLTKYESDIRSYLEELKGDKFHDSKDIENLLKKLDVASQEKINLETQIKIYESVLAETVLNENEELKTENQTLRTNLEQLQGLREALYEIEELRLKLQKEENEKKMLLEKIGNLDSAKNTAIPLPENNILQIPQSNNMPTKSEKKKKSRKRGASGKK